MSTRHMLTLYGQAELDHGAPFFHATDSRFRAAVALWRQAGLVAPWPEAGADAWVGVPRMNAVVAHLAVHHRVKWNTFIGGLLCEPRGAWRLSSDHGPSGPFDAVIVAIPAEQAVPILALYDLDMARTAAQAASHPCWSGLFVFQDTLPAAARLLRNEGPIALAVPNRAKPAREGPEAWVVHATPEWSAAHLEHAPAAVVPLLLAALEQALDLTSLPPYEATAHRWRHAFSDGIGQPALWNPDLRLGACGDWLMGPRAECAWLSGRSLAQRIVKQASGTAADAPVPRARGMRNGNGTR